MRHLPAKEQLFIYLVQPMRNEFILIQLLIPCQKYLNLEDKNTVVVEESFLNFETTRKSSHEVSLTSYFCSGWSRWDFLWMSGHHFGGRLTSMLLVLYLVMLLCLSAIITAFLSRPCRALWEICPAGSLLWSTGTWRARMCRRSLLKVRGTVCMCNYSRRVIKK